MRYHVVDISVSACISTLATSASSSVVLPGGFDAELAASQAIRDCATAACFLVEIGGDSGSPLAAVGLMVLSLSGARTGEKTKNGSAKNGGCILLSAARIDIDLCKRSNHVKYVSTCMRGEQRLCRGNMVCYRWVVRIDGSERCEVTSEPHCTSDVDHDSGDMARGSEE